MRCDNIICRNIYQKFYEFWDYINSIRTKYNIDIVYNLFFLFFTDGINEVQTQAKRKCNLTKPCLF